MTRACWCGGALGKEIGPYYRCCDECGAAVLALLPGPEHFDVCDDEHAFYGRRYWTEYSAARCLPDIRERARADLSERCVFWLDRLLEATRPPGRALEIGCGHGGFVRLMRELGFDAVGTELSGWVVEFARRTFGVPVLKGRLETLDLAPGFTCIAAFDVLEHVEDPLAMIRRCRELLAPDGVLLLQTPWYRGEGPEWSMFQPDEHIHLFSEGSIRLLLERAGFKGMHVQPSFFPYDMWVVASLTELPLWAGRERPGGGDWRLPVAFRSLLDLSHQIADVRGSLALAEADRAARLGQIEELTRQVRELEALRVEEAEARRQDVEKLTALLRESEADRAARFEQIEELTRQVRELEALRVEEAEARRQDVEKLTALLRESEADRRARLDQMEELTRQVRGLEAVRLEDDMLKALLREAETDRTARLRQVEELTRQVRAVEALRQEEAEARRQDVEKLAALLQELEADRAARLGQVEELTRQVRAVEALRQEEAEARRHDVEKLTALLQESEADRGARLGQVEELTGVLRESEADRKARFEQIQDLSRRLREVEADREARLEVIRKLEGRIDKMERTWAWRLYRALPGSGVGWRSTE